MKATNETHDRVPIHSTPPSDAAPERHDHKHAGDHPEHASQANASHEHDRHDHQEDDHR